MTRERQVVETRGRYVIEREGRTYGARFRLEQQRSQPPLELFVWTGTRGYLHIGPPEDAPASSPIATLDLDVFLAALERIRRLRARDRARARAKR